MSRSGHGIVRLLVLLGALAGLFAMHGLADHGMPASGAHGAVVAAHVEQGVHPEAVPPPPAPHEMGAMGAMCVAVLGLGLLLLTLLGRRRALPRRARSVVRPAAAPVSRDRAPPDLHILSVSRC